MNKIKGILEQLISDVVEEKEQDGRNDSDDDEDSARDEETESEVEEQTSEDCSNDDNAVTHSCKICHKLFSTKGNKEHHENCFHKRDHVDKSAYSCKLVDSKCKRVFSSKTSLRYHQLRIHGKAVSCEKCSKEFTDVKEFVEHKRSEHSNPERPVVVECKICKIPITGHLKRHMREVHEMPTKNPLKEPAEKHHCPHCSVQFKRVENMQ